jgi:hypothetical protein
MAASIRRAGTGPAPIAGGWRAAFEHVAQQIVFEESIGSIEHAE